MMVPYQRQPNHDKIIVFTHLISFGDIADLLASGRVDGRERLATLGSHKLIVNEKLLGEMEKSKSFF